MSVWNSALIIVDGWLAGGGTLLTDSVTPQTAGSPFPSLSRISSSAAGLWLGVKLEWWENHRNAKGRKLIGKAKVSAVRGRSREHLHAIASASDHLNKQTVQNQNQNQHGPEHVDLFHLLKQGMRVYAKQHQSAGESRKLTVGLLYGYPCQMFQVVPWSESDV